ncbi:MAG: hypothetical protein C0467_30695 [Planctomycetaceae bacterium]|nr:hypothetical protein [Planctomycetaceae bacterium]
MARRKPHPSGLATTLAAKPAAFYIPVNFNSEVFPPDERNYACYFLNLLHWRYVCWRANAAGFVQLRWDYLTRIMPRQVWFRVWRVLLDDRRDGGAVIERDNCYAPGEKALGYRLAPGFRRVHRVLCSDDRLNRKIRKLYDGKPNRLPVHDHLQENLNRIEFNAERASEIIATLYPDPDCRMETAEYRGIVSGLCQRIADGERRLCCDRFGRVHTSFTSLHRELRSCLSVEGKPLLGFDIANSQPLMAGLLARRFCRSPWIRSRMGTTEFSENGNPYCYRALMEYCDHPGVPDDVREYIQICESGRLYESFGTDREQVKKGFMSILMGPNRYQGPVKAEFTAKYPTLADMLSTVRRKAHARAAWLLQNLEATIMIHGVCRKLSLDHRNLPVYSVHDCLFTSEEHADYLTALIMSELRNIQVVPSLKTC